MQLGAPSVDDAREAGEAELGEAESGAGGMTSGYGAAAGRARPAVPRRPVVERIACWSARHKVIALVAWLVVVGGAVGAGHLFSTRSQPQYDPGPSGVA